MLRVQRDSLKFIKPSFQCNKKSIAPTVFPLYSSGLGILRSYIPKRYKTNANLAIKPLEGIRVLELGQASIF